MVETATIATTTSTAPPAPAAPTTAPQSVASRPGIITDSAYDQLPTDADRDRFSRVRKGPDGGSEWRERSTLPSETNPAAKPATGDASAAAGAADGKLRVGEFELSSDDVAVLMQTKAAADLRKTQVPASADAYETRLPEGLQLPAGIEFSFNKDSAEIKALQTWAFSQGFTGQQYREMLGHYANSVAAQELIVANAAKAEVEKLGAMGTARVTAVDQWLRGLLGDDHGKAVRGMMVTSKIVEGLEKLMTKFVSQGAASFRQDGREPPGQPGRVSEEAYAAMSPAERWDYARGFNQKQFR
jgi:hypothetical protein